MCLLPVVQAAQYTLRIPESFNFIPGGGLHTCGIINKMTGSNLVRDMSALLLLCHHGLLPGFQCLTLFPADTGNPCIQHLVCAEQHKDETQSTPPEKSHPGFAVNKTGDDMKPDTQENTHIPVISSRGKENLYLCTVKLSCHTEN